MGAGFRSSSQQKLLWSLGELALGRISDCVIRIDCPLHLSSFASASLRLVITTARFPAFPQEHRDLFLSAFNGRTDCPSGPTSDASSDELWSSPDSIAATDRRLNALACTRVNESSAAGLCMIRNAVPGTHRCRTGCS